MTTTTGLLVERILDHDQQHVQVTLDPEQVIDGLARALKNHHIYLTLLLAETDEAARREARRQLVAALSRGEGALTLVLNPDEARAVSEELDVAARDAYPCRLAHCDHLSEGDLCDAHQDSEGGHARWSA